MTNSDGRSHSDVTGLTRRKFIKSSAVAAARPVLGEAVPLDRGGRKEASGKHHPNRVLYICDQFRTQYRNFNFEDIVCQNVIRVGVSSLGSAAKSIEDIYLKNITIEKAAGDIAIEYMRSWISENVRIN